MSTKKNRGFGKNRDGEKRPPKGPNAAQQALVNVQAAVPTPAAKTEVKRDSFVPKEYTVTISPQTWLRESLSYHYMRRANYIYEPPAHPFLAERIAQATGFYEKLRDALGIPDSRDVYIYSEEIVQEILAEAGNNPRADVTEDGLVNWNITISEELDQYHADLRSAKNLIFVETSMLYVLEYLVSYRDNIRDWRTMDNFNSIAGLLYLQTAVFEDPEKYIDGANFDLNMVARGPVRTITSTGTKKDFENPYADKILISTVTDAYNDIDRQFFEFLPTPSQQGKPAEENSDEMKEYLAKNENERYIGVTSFIFSLTNYFGRDSPNRLGMDAIIYTIAYIYLTLLLSDVTKTAGNISARMHSGSFRIPRGRDVMKSLRDRPFITCQPLLTKSIYESKHFADYTCLFYGNPFAGNFSGMKTDLPAGITPSAPYFFIMQRITRANRGDNRPLPVNTFRVNDVEVATDSKTINEFLDALSIIQATDIPIVLVSADIGQMSIGMANNDTLENTVFMPEMGVDRDYFYNVLRLTGSDNLYVGKIKAPENDMFLSSTNKPRARTPPKSPNAPSGSPQPFSGTLNAPGEPAPQAAAIFQGPVTALPVAKQAPAQPQAQAQAQARPLSAQTFQPQAQVLSTFPTQPQAQVPAQATTWQPTTVQNRPSQALPQQTSATRAQAVPDYMGGNFSDPWQTANIQTGRNIQIPGGFGNIQPQVPAAAISPVTPAKSSRDEALSDIKISISDTSSADPVVVDTNTIEAAQQKDENVKYLTNFSPDIKSALESEPARISMYVKGLGQGSLGRYEAISTLTEHNIIYKNKLISSNLINMRDMSSQDRSAISTFMQIAVNFIYGETSYIRTNGADSAKINGTLDKAITQIYQKSASPITYVSDTPSNLRKLYYDLVNQIQVNIATRVCTYIACMLPSPNKDIITRLMQVRLYNLAVLEDIFAILQEIGLRIVGCMSVEDLLLASMYEDLSGINSKDYIENGLKHIKPDDIIAAKRYMGIADFTVLCRQVLGLPPTDYALPIAYTPDESEILRAEQVYEMMSRALGDNQ